VGLLGGYGNRVSLDRGEGLALFTFY
jgi:hypothetical protein